MPGLRLEKRAAFATLITDEQARINVNEFSLDQTKANLVAGFDRHSLHSASWSCCNFRKSLALP